MVRILNRGNNFLYRPAVFSKGPSDAEEDRHGRIFPNAFEGVGAFYFRNDAGAVHRRNVFSWISVSGARASIGAGSRSPRHRCKLYHDPCSTVGRSPHATCRFMGSRFDHIHHWTRAYHRPGSKEVGCSGHVDAYGV